MNVSEYLAQTPAPEPEPTVFSEDDNGCPVDPNGTRADGFMITGLMGMAQ